MKALAFAACVALLALSVTIQSPSPGAGSEPAVPGVDDYEDRVKPFFKKHCIKCHGPKVTSHFTR